MSQLHNLPDFVTLNTILQNPTTTGIFLIGILALIVIGLVLAVVFAARSAYELCENRFRDARRSSIRGVVSVALALVGVVLVLAASSLAAGYTALFLGIIGAVCIIRGIVGCVGAMMLRCSEL